ncbi:hypothetical protein POX_h09511 [Penicillium oxalicum]|uniref:Uncharacterized protein n=1 Tax=Penicillium oxalicum (strain 114-2 / CGMCC 5302) TaxID=933388 RepID=S8B8X7_PENO1|nr:hypothetical protein POX_h09511 [Penicillium oxalicum]EPS31212.1 hypothetical protein PDE_06167 [Penicillium oxalicum 114-2]KAI2785752.1 hypothetical protein POX_h09511 [Penicillium oxalicum]
MSTQSHSIVPPTTAESLAAFSQDISRVMTTSFRTSVSSQDHHKTTKTSSHFIDGMPPAPPPSPVSFAIDSNGGQCTTKFDEISRLSLD